MAKDPAFLFYPSDFFMGTSLMTFEDKGKYITLLCVMHQKGHLSENAIKSLVGEISEELKEKLSIDESGLFYNKRLDQEIENRRNFVESRRNNGLKGGRPRKDKPLGKPKDNLMDKDRLTESEPTEDENKDVIVNKVFKEKEIHTLQKFVEENLSVVSQLENQLSFSECEKLLKVFPEQNIKSKLEAMENYKGLSKKYNSVYRTVLTWLKKDGELNQTNWEKRNGHGSRSTNESVFDGTDEL
jgi:hypothetical protein